MKKVLGILGGMGPAATADLYGKIVALTDAASDSEHIRTIIDSNVNIPDRTAAILHGGASPVSEMKMALDNLVKCGAEIIIVPCNTAHYFLDELITASSQAGKFGQGERPVNSSGDQAPACPVFLSMIDETAKVCAEINPKTPTILATKGTLETGLYQKALDAVGVKYLVPDDNEKEILMDVIYNGVKAGKEPDAFVPAFTGLLSDLKSKGADYFILACTELPIAFRYAVEIGNAAGKFSVVDPTEVLARAAIRACGYAVKSE